MRFWNHLTWQGQLLAQMPHAFAVLLHSPLHLTHHITGSLHKQCLDTHTSLHFIHIHGLKKLKHPESCLLVNQHAGLAAGACHP